METKKKYIIKVMEEAMKRNSVNDIVWDEYTRRLNLMEEMMKKSPKPPPATPMIEVTESCETCEHRFKCFTVKEGRRPKKIKGIVPQVSMGICEYCKHYIPDKDGYGYNIDVGMCSYLTMITHKKGSCGNYDPMTKPHLRWNDTHDFVNAKEREEAIRKRLQKKNHLTRCPKYCIMSAEWWKNKGKERDNDSD